MISKQAPSVSVIINGLVEVFYHKKSEYCSGMIMTSPFSLEIL